MKLWVGVAVAAATVASSQFARGAEAPVVLAWDAPAGCPDRASVEAEIVRSLGTARRGATLSAGAVVRREGSEWKAVLVTTRGAETGERELWAPSCALLAKATALALALAAARPDEPLLAPDALPLSAASSPSPVERPQADSSSSSSSSVPVEQPSAPALPRTGSSDAIAAPLAARTRFAIGASLAVDFGALPHAGVGPSLHIAWRPSRLEAELGLLYLAGQHATLGDRGAATFYLATASARLCYVVPLALAVGPCAWMDLGTLGAASTGPLTTSAASLWAAPGFSVRVRWPKDGRLAASGDLGAAIALARPEFVLDGVRHVYQAAPLTARGTIGIEARFP